MTYTADTPIIGTGRVTAAGIQSFFVERGKAAAPQFAPGGQYKPPPTELGEIIVELANSHGVNHDMMAAQIGHESAWWQSRIVRDKNNPSGLGATNDAPYENAITFPSAWYGVQATVAHLLSYVHGDESELTHVSVRHEVLRGAGYLGVATVWRDLNGRWAWPGETYAQSIAARANEMVTFAEARGEIIGEGEPVSTINGVPLRVDFIPRGNSNRPGYAMVPEWITVHETGNPNRGANAEMHRRFVNAGGGSGNVSWHYTVDDKEIVQHLPLLENGWHAGDGGNGTGNRKSIGIETCVNADGDWGKTLDHLARLIVWLQAEYNIPETRIVQHNHWSGKNCPARMRASGGRGWRDLLTMVAGYRASEPATPDNPCRYFDVTGHYLCHGFRGFWEENGGLAIFGYPLSTEFTKDGITVQWFERARLEHQPDIAGNKHGVVLGRIGAESRKQDQEHYPEAFERQEPPT